MRKKLFRFLVPIFALMLFAGCNNESSDSDLAMDEFYDDVGELDLDTRDRYYVRSNSGPKRALKAVPAPNPAPEHYAQARTPHARFVGEMELDQ